MPKEVNTNDPCYLMYDKDGNFLGVFPCVSDSYPENARWAAEVFPVEEARIIGKSEDDK